jgi:hypothetical protein
VCGLRAHCRRAGRDADGLPHDVDGDLHVPFIGVLPERQSLFRPEPRAMVAVNDAAAWRLNPAHRQVYDKLNLALAAGLRAAPCGVDPRDEGLTLDVEVFVKPIINLGGMAVRARAVPAHAVPSEPGSFWCERLEGAHTSTDCLVQDGCAVWFAHTRGSDEKDAERPVYWEVGADLPELEPIVAAWVSRLLPGYTGICNLEMIDGRPIEMHLRGSNGFFDFYGPEFMRAWVALVDGDPGFSVPPPIPGGYVISLFGDVAIEDAARAAAAERGVRVDLDRRTPGRSAVLRCRDRAVGLAVLAELRGAGVSDRGSDAA